jgi:hypothetical protein
MNNEKKIVNLVKKLKSKFVGKNPTEVYAILKNEDFYKTIITHLTPKDYLILIFMLSNDDERIDLSGLYNVISFNLFSFQTGLMMEIDPSVECEKCDGQGDTRCDECGSDGEVECSNCGGSGEIGDEETCDDCNGSGQVTCDYCDGEGWRQCEYCAGSTQETCNACDGSGETTEYDKQGIEFKDIISYDKNFKDEYTEQYSVSLNPNLERKFYDSKMYLIVESKEEVNDDFKDDFNTDDYFLVEVADANIKVNIFGAIRVTDLPY